MRSRASQVEGRGPAARALWLLVAGLALNVPAQEELPKLLPPKGEIAPTFWELHGTSVMVSVPVAMLLLAVGIWLLLRPKPVAPTPPEVQARTALEALLQTPEDGQLLSRVSQILRRYVQVVFQLPPGEPTTAEFCQLIATRNEIGDELAAALAEFLRQCDKRKFARTDSASPLGAVARALELLAQGERRRAELSQPASVTTRPPATVSA